MAKRRTSRTSAAKAPETAAGSPAGASRVVVALVALAFLSVMLAMFQWHELIRSMDGVQAFCKIGEGLDCSKVWMSDFAKVIHRWTGLPLAGWGIVWSVAALASALAVGFALMNGRWSSSSVAAARWTGAGGIAACVGFAAASAAIGAFCITCVTTYGLVTLYGVLAFRLPEEQWLARSGLRMPAVVVLAAYLALLYPGRQTPVSANDAVREAMKNREAPARSDAERGRAPPRDAAPERSPSRRPAGDESAEATTALGRFLSGLPGPARRAVRDALTTYRNSEPVANGDRFGERPASGEADAPVRIVDFVDVGCSHCARLMDNLEAIRREVEVPFAVETRYFPLDGACNEALPQGSGDPLSVRCLGAKLLLCAQGDDAYAELKHRVFEHYDALRTEALYRWGREILGEDREALEACVTSRETEARLAQDVAYGRLFDPKGTPLVIVNGRQGSPLPPFLYAIILAGGDPEAKGFDEAGL